MKVVNGNLKKMFKEFDKGMGQHQEKMAKNILNAFQDQMIKLRNDVSLIKTDAERENMESRLNK